MLGGRDCTCARESVARAHRTPLAGAVIRASVRLVTYRRACRLAYRLKVSPGEPAVAPGSPTGLVAPGPLPSMRGGLPSAPICACLSLIFKEKWSPVTMSRYAVTMSR